MVKYFVARVSSKDQNLARQLEAAKKYGSPEENVFCDKISGRKKDRPEYDRLKYNVLQQGDEVYFEELDRIGRDKSLIKEELEWFKDGLDAKTVEHVDQLSYLGLLEHGAVGTHLCVEYLSAFALAPVAVCL